MAEAFDALLDFDLLSTVLQVAGLVVLGVALEWGVRFAQRSADHRGWSRTGVVLRALSGLPIFWSALLVAMLVLQGFSDVSDVRRLGRAVVRALLLISLAVIFARILVRWIRLATAKHALASSSIFNYLINGFAVFIVLMVVLYTLRVSVSVILVTFLGSTLGLSFALREPLSNLFAGLVLTASGRLSPGDFVRLPSGEQGRVIDIQWDVTLIRQANEGHVIVPNSHVTQAEIINFDWMKSGYLLQVELGVDYGSDLDQVERVTIEVGNEVLRQVGGGELLAPTYIWYKAFDDSDIKFTVYLRCREFADHAKVRHEFLKQIERRYAREGIVMPYPTLAVQTSPAHQQPTGGGTEAGKSGPPRDRTVDG